MLTYRDCLALSLLSEEEVKAIARHEHVPEIVALELGWALSKTPEGRWQVQRMIRENAEHSMPKL